MTQPLGLVLYERLLPGTQLVNRLQDLNYRVQAVTDAETFVSCADQEKPMLILVDLVSTRADICGAIRRLKESPATQHIPVIAFAPEDGDDLRAAAQAAGAALVAGDSAILNHLAEFLEQALHIE
jgi:CheY-like chemotaxis protein